MPLSLRMLSFVVIHFLPVSAGSVVSLVCICELCKSKFSLEKGGEVAEINSVFL